MASSRIEIVSSRYDCVLRDRNQRINIERNSEGTQASLRKNLEEFVRDHLHTCIALSAPSDADTAFSDENSRPGFSNRGCRDRNNNNNSSSHNIRLESVERESNYNNNNQETESAPPSESPTTSMMRRQLQMLDQWAARPARERINTTEKQTNEAELLALSNSHSVTARTSSFLRDNWPTASESSVELPTLRASSLVQMWREIEAESTVPTGNQSCRGSLNFNPVVSRSSSSGSCSSRNNSTMSSIGDSCYVEDPFVKSEVYESGGRTYKAITVPEDSNDERYEAVAVPEDSFPDWESGRTAASEPHSLFQRQSSNVGESERGRVADIIKRLTSASRPQSPVASLNDETDRDHSFESSSRDHSSIDHGNTPRVRCQQAIKDLLLQREQEKLRELNGLVERHAVSRFSQRGRLQSLLRFKVLQREAAAQDQQRPAPAVFELNQLQCRPTILRLRERFNSNAGQNGPSVSSRENNSRSTTSSRINTQESEQSGTLSRDGNHQEGGATTTLDRRGPQAQERHSVQSTGEPLQEEESQSSDVTWEGLTSGAVSQLDCQGTVNTAESSHCSEGDIITEEQGLETQQHAGSSDGWEGPSSGIDHLDWQQPVETAESSNGSEGDVTTEEPDLENQHRVGSIDGWQQVMVTEESDPNTQQLVESNIETWQSDTPHSESDFECRRQAWYRNMLESNSDNDEIRALFERRSVSTFLTSGLRARMDQMVCSFLRRQSHQVSSIAEEYEEEEEEEVSPISHQYNEVSDDSASLQLPLPSRLRSLSQYQDNDVSDGYDQFALPQSSRSYGEDSQQFSPFTRHSSVEMELIYDLRGHMAQLSQEMSELRKSIQSCMGMQVKLQHSIKNEVSAAVGHSIRGADTTESLRRQPTRRTNCCICYEMQVDSLLYRCGHMCTCFKCAYELQWSSGRCPICRAPIVDVVRAYADS